MTKLDNFWRVWVRPNTLLCMIIYFRNRLDYNINLKFEQALELLRVWLIQWFTEFLLFRFLKDWARDLRVYMCHRFPHKCYTLWARLAWQSVHSGTCHFILHLHLFTWKECVCVCEHVRVHRYRHMFMCVQVSLCEGMEMMLNVLLNHSSFYLKGIESCWMQSLPIGASLVGNLALELTHLFHEGWYYRRLTMSDWLVHMCWESELQPSCLHSKCFICSIIYQLPP